jgi:hypothetical protein
MISRQITAIICFISLVSACSLRTKYPAAHCHSRNEIQSGSEAYHCDSLLIDLTAKQWIDSSYGEFGRYSERNVEQGKYKVYVGKIFNDSSRLKLTAFVYVGYNADKGYGADSIYPKGTVLFDSHTVMGIRNSKKDLWRLFELDEIFIGLRGDSLASAIRFHESIFLSKQQMAERSVGVFDAKTGLNTKGAPVEYIPCEDGFWTKSPLWRKGDRMPGYYLFETYMNASPLKKELRPTRTVSYQDSVITLFRKS